MKRKDENLFAILNKAKRKKINIYRLEFILLKRKKEEKNEI